MRRSLGSIRFVAILTLSLLGVVTHAQEGFVYRVTGDVVLTLAGAERTFHVYAVDIPENVADGVQNPEVRARLEQAAGTTEHGATWAVPAPVSIGGIVISAPTTMSIVVAARPTEDRDAGLGEVRLDFQLDLATLALPPAADAPVSVWFFPEAFASRDFYALTEGTLTVTNVEAVDDATLRIEGTIDGALSFQASLAGIAHNPADTIVVTGRFELQQVVGTQSLTEVRPR